MSQTTMGAPDPPVPAAAGEPRMVMPPAADHARVQRLCLWAGLLMVPL
nr:hypothetical protein [Actinomycetota bacterium]